MGTWGWRRWLGPGMTFYCTKRSRTVSAVASWWMFSAMFVHFKVTAYKPLNVLAFVQSLPFRSPFHGLEPHCRNLKAARQGFSSSDQAVMLKATPPH